MPTNMASAAYHSAAKALTMAVINPWAFSTPVEAVSKIALAVAAKATIYLVESLEAQLRQTDEWETSNLTTELTRQGLELAEIAVEQLVAANYQKYYLFQINPRGLSKSFSKIRDNKLTGRGYTQDTHGNSLISYSYQGRTASMRPPLGIMRMPQLTAAWHYLALFEKFFLTHDTDMIFVWDDEAIVGRFDSFSYDLDADNPWMINYRFQISCYPDTKFGLRDGYIGAAFAAIRPSGIPDPRDVAAGMLPSAPRVGGSRIDVFEDTYGQLAARESVLL